MRYFVLALLWFFQQPETPSGSQSVTSLIVRISPTEVASFKEAMLENEYSLEHMHHAGDLYRLKVFTRLNPLLLDRLVSEQILVGWQYDQPIELRNTPNDPLFEEQWGMQRIGMEQAWNSSTGGVTVTGDTIVVAILDVGYDLDHPDLRDNIWKNRGEIPNDGQDNDGNGYVDDYAGLNIQTGDDVHETDVHGTAIAGIIGAKGNNALTIAGVNWNVKILLISGIENESDIIEGYQYLTDLRQKYNASNGAEGAFIVASNLSAGINNGRPADHQMWCDEYEAMGAVGILGACATANADTNVDIDGDMPTTCTSDYLIAVTNTDIDDEKVQFAGYGPIHIDLAAPGTPTLSTDIGGGTDEITGTSAATPHVAGAIALLYAVACEDLVQFRFSDPDALALQIKELLLNNVDPIESLEPLTLTGGRLNVAEAVAALNEVCTIDGGELDILYVSPNPVLRYGSVVLNIPDLRPYVITIYDSAGRLILKDTPAFSAPGEQGYSFSASHFIPGVYFVQVEHGDECVAEAFIVQ